MALTRLRIVVVGVIAVRSAVAAGRIFDRSEPIILVGAVLPRSRRWRGHARVAAVAPVVAAGRAGRRRSRSSPWCSPAGSCPATSSTPSCVACRGVLSTEWPSPRTADLVGAVTLAVAVATALAAGLASARRSHLAPLVPLLLGVRRRRRPPARPAGPAVVAPGRAPAPARCARRVRRRHPAAGTGPALVRGAPARAHRRRRRGRRHRRLAGAVDDRACRSRGPTTRRRTVPRARSDRGGQGAAGVEPPIDLFRVELDGGPTAGEVADGGRRHLRRRAVAGGGDAATDRAAPRPRTASARRGSGVEFVTDDLDLVPLPGDAVTVDAAVETDAGRHAGPHRRAARSRTRLVADGRPDADIADAGRRRRRHASRRRVRRPRSPRRLAALSSRGPSRPAHRAARTMRDGIRPRSRRARRRASSRR